MGKSRKRSRHFNTGYPYNPIRVAHIHVVRPKVRHDTDSSLFIGEAQALTSPKFLLPATSSLIPTQATSAIQLVAGKPLFRDCGACDNIPPCMAVAPSSTWFCAVQLSKQPHHGPSGSRQTRGAMPAPCMCHLAPSLAALQQSLRGMSCLHACMPGLDEVALRWPHAGLFVDGVHPGYGGAEKRGRRRGAALKRLDFIRAYSEYYWVKAHTVAAALYGHSRALCPASLDGGLRAVEGKVSELGSPLLAAVQSRSEQVLTSLDRKVRQGPSAGLVPSLVACAAACVREASNSDINTADARRASGRCTAPQLCTCTDAGREPAPGRGRRWTLCLCRALHGIVQPGRPNFRAVLRWDDCAPLA